MNEIDKNKGTKLKRNKYVIKFSVITNVSKNITIYLNSSNFFRKNNLAYNLKGNLTSLSYLAT